MKNPSCAHDNGNSQVDCITMFERKQDETLYSQTGTRLVLRLGIEIKAGPCGLFLLLKPQNFSFHFPNVNDSQHKHDQIEYT